LVTAELPDMEEKGAKLELECETLMARGDKKRRNVKRRKVS
jgi:hypothetical protein